MPVPVEELAAWHGRPGALERLTPPWERVEVVSRGDGIEPGSRTVLRVGRFPFRSRWVAEHRPLDDGRGFRDVQVEGPFARWTHEHRFREDGPEASVLEDRVEYALPLGLLGRAAAGRWVRRRLERTFAYRHRTLSADLAAHRSGRPERPLRVAVTGASGLVGRALVPFLTAGGHEVVRLVRRPPRVGAPEVRWDPEGFVDTEGLEGVDAVVHLAGENIFARWTEEKRQAIRESRVRGTRVLAQALAGLERPPRVLVSASGVNYYGDAGEERLDEESPPGEGFLAGVCRGWEEAASEAAEAGIRVVRMRFGVVLSPEGGALALMLPAFRLGLGGPVGGDQWMSWISRDDLVGALHRAVVDDELTGPVNAVAPHPVRNRELTSALGRVLGRPAVLRVPPGAVRLAAGQMAEETVLASIRAVPAGLETAGYRFRHPGVEDALRHVLGRAGEGG